MNIIYTKHFLERTAARFKQPEEYVKKTVEYMFKLVKKNKIMPERGETPDVFTIRYGEFKVIYTKSYGDIILITIGKRDLDRILH